MYKVLIIEDEKPAAEWLGQLIQKFDSRITILAVIDSVRGAKEWLDQHAAPDLAFMDIQLADGLSFEIFEQVKVPCPVIFTTAYEEYAIKAFKVNSIDYLLKPIAWADLEAAFQKFANQSGNVPAAAPVTLDLLNKVNALQRRINAIQSEQQRLQGQESELIRQLATEQGRWSGLNQGLDELERNLAKPQNR